jgi:hypothetical protein
VSQADAHQRAKFQQLQPDDAAGRIDELRVRQSKPKPELIGRKPPV